MQALLASLVVSMSVKDAAYKAGMATARAEAQKTGQEFQRSGKDMRNAMDRAADGVDAALHRIADSMIDLQKKVRNAGLALTVGLTAPLTGVALVSKNAASDFQSAMNKVRAAMVTASPDQIDKLRMAALKLGPAIGKSGIDAAEAIEALAKNGMSAADILAGGLQSALTLSVVGQADLGAAANLTTDVLSQFGKTAGDLPTIVDKVSGALDVSKMGFDDYRLAIGQVGGVAGGLGYTFDDMNVALASTASFFDAGSDAGTSFKSFILSLNGQSKEATSTMSKLGISFFETEGAAKGAAKPIGEIAEILRTKLGNLNDKSLRAALTNMFGSDGMRTALALMKEGAAGIAAAQASIDKVTAEQKTSILLKGEAEATKRLGNAWEKLKINIGEAGIVQMFTAIKDGLASVINALGNAPPWFYQLGVAVGVVAAAIGPLILAGLTLGKVMLPLLLLRLGPVALGFAALINPVGVMIRLLGQLALQAGAATLIGAIGVRLVALASPVGMVITLLSIFVPMMLKTAEASDHYREAQEKLNELQTRGIDIATRLAAATGKAKDAALKSAVALRADAAAALQHAKADAVAARAAFARAQVSTPNIKDVAKGPMAYTGGGSGAAFAFLGGKQNQEQATADYQVALDNIKKARGLFDEIDQSIKRAEAPAKPKQNVDFDIDRKGPKGRDTSGDASDYAAKLADLRNAQLDAQADLTGSVQARYRADMAALASERARYVHELAVDKGLNDAQRATMLAAKDEEITKRRAIAEQARSIGLAEQAYDEARARNDVEQQLTRGASDLAQTAGDRRAAELRLLDLQRQQEEADLELVLATKDTASAEYGNALMRKGRLDEIYAQQRTSVMHQTENPAEAYMRTLSPALIGEGMQDAGVSALKDLNTQLAEAVTGTVTLASAFRSMKDKIVSALAEIAIQQALIKPLASALFGAAEGASGGGLFTSIGSLLSRTFGGGKATGGGVSASNWYVVGEKGPEVFAPGVSGAIIPNGGMGAKAGGRPVTFDLRGALTTADVLAQMQAIAAQTGGAILNRSVEHTNDMFRLAQRQAL